MKTTFDLDPTTNLRIASIVFERCNGERFIVNTGPGEDAWKALQRHLYAITLQVCEVQIVQTGKIYKAIFPDGTTETFSAII